MTDSPGKGYRLGYARVSTLGQDPARQHDAPKGRWGRADLHRPGLRRTHRTAALSALLEQLRPGDTLVVWRLDRLGRATSHLIQTVTALEERGVGFASLTESIDTTTPAGRVLIGVLAALAGSERDLIRERTLAGLQAARERGRVGGRPTSMTPDKLAVAARVLSEGRSKSTIAATIGISGATLYSYLGRLQSDAQSEISRG